MSDRRSLVLGKYHELKQELRKKSLSATAFRQRLAEEIDPLLKDFERVDFEKVLSYAENLKSLQQEILELKEKMDAIDEEYNIE
ncbi:MAG: hypothetical protein HBSAPP04_13040 [Ignavibacteriaceae bacterium]|nr:MAG: hypothetical protein HBSAPP04_13040 [Ignavibacteriaceae bacterium]